MEVSDWLTLIGWFASFLLGIISAIIVHRHTSKKSIVAWAVLSENTIFSLEQSAQLGIPVKFEVAGTEQQSLSVINLRLGSAGNTVIEDFRVVITLNRDANIMSARTLDDLGEFSRHMNLETLGHQILIQFKFLNPERRQIDLEVIAGGYELGAVTADLAEPGVSLQRREASKWDIQTSILKSVALSIAGIRYDPTVSPLNEIADEMRQLRRQIRIDNIVGTMKKPSLPRNMTTPDASEE